MYDVPGVIITALTEGFSLSIVAAATSPAFPTSSGHELLPTSASKHQLELHSTIATKLMFVYMVFLVRTNFIILQHA